MTEQQKTIFINALHANTAEFHSPWVDVNDAVQAMVDILTKTIKDMECTND